MLTLELCAQSAHIGTMLGAAMGGGGGVSIDFDRTFLAQMVLFALLVVVLKPLLFDPVLKVFEQREVRTEGAKADARKMQEQAGVLLRKYEKELERVHQVAAEERDRLRTETAKLEKEILDEARESTGRIVDEGRQQIGEQVNAIRFDLGKQSEQLARDIASRVLGREVG
jgi:F-type H+-transporting ATPase subunit b